MMIYRKYYIEEMNIEIFSEEQTKDNYNEIIGTYIYILLYSNGKELYVGEMEKS